MHRIIHMIWCVCLKIEGPAMAMGDVNPCCDIISQGHPLLGLEPSLSVVLVVIWGTISISSHTQEY